MTGIMTASRPIRGLMASRLWENRSEAGRCGNTERPLTHLIDSTDRQDAVKAINSPAPVHAVEQVQETPAPQGPICGPESPGVATPPQNPLNGSDAPSSDERRAVQATCSIAGCEKPTKARGWCGMHYWRWSKHGDPQWLPPTTGGECPVDGCGRVVASAGYCGTHYSRLRRTGTVATRAYTSAGGAAVGQERGTVEQDRVRFLSKIDQRGPRLCWPWLGTILSTGYGQFHAQGKKHMAHRYAYRLFIGAIPKGNHVDHVWARGCMRHDCVNPHHLESVTPLENLRRARNTSRELGRSA